MDSVARLPAGAVYTARQGQATLRVGHDGQGRLVAESECDSISRRCFYLEKELTRISRENSLGSVEQQPPASGPTGWQWFWIRTGQIAAGVCGSILIGGLFRIFGYRRTK